MSDVAIRKQLLQSIKEGNVKKANYIVSIRKNMVNCMLYGKSPLVWAKELEKDEIVKCLTEKGGEEFVIGEEQEKQLFDKLKEGLLEGDDDKIEEALIDGANIDKKEGEYVWSLLLKEVFEDNTENAKKLLDLGADIEAKDKYGRTALWYAGAYNSNKEMVDVLIERGANLGITDVRGNKFINDLRDDMKEYVLGQFEKRKKKELQSTIVFDRER